MDIINIALNDLLLPSHCLALSPLISWYPRVKGSGAEEITTYIHSSSFYQISTEASTAWAAVWVCKCDQTLLFFQLIIQAHICPT